MKYKSLIVLVFFILNCSNKNSSYLIQDVEKAHVRKVDSYKFTGINSVDFDSDDNIYLLDAINYRLFKFDSTWNLIRQFIRKGGAPGDFNFYPKDVKVAFDKIYVLGDYLLNVYDLNGKFIASNKKVISSGSNLAVNLKDSLIYVGCPISSKTNGKNILLYQSFFSNGKLKKNVYLDSKIFNSLKGFHEKTFISYIDDRIVLNFNQTNYFLIFNQNDSLVGKIKLPFEIKQTNKQNSYYSFSSGPLIKLTENLYMLRRPATPLWKSFIQLFDKNLKYVKNYKYSKNDKFINSQIDGKVHKGKLYFWEDLLYSDKIYCEKLNYEEILETK